MSVLTDILDNAVRAFPEFDILFYEERSYTNLELDRRSCRIANALRELGMAPGDVLLAHMENSPDFFTLVTACARMGIVLCPTMFLISAEELSWMVEHSGASYLVTTPGLLAKIKLASPAHYSHGRVILVSKEREAGTLSLEELISDQPEAIENRPALSDEDIAALLYTAGTTGKPKGVLLTHGNIGSNVRAIAASNRISRDETALSALPLSHSFGLTTSLLPALCGMRSVLLPWFDAEKVLAYTERFHVRTMPGVPAMFIQLLNHPHAPNYNTKSWLRLQSGAAPLPLEVLRAFHDKFGVYLYEGYGLTEASPVVSCQTPFIPFKAGSVGLPLEGVEVSIRDEFEHELPPGSPGEITVRGPNVMKGYLRDEEESERALRGGWLHTGDIGYLDEDGYLYIVERKKDLIISGGFNLYPSEVERILERHPAVAEAAVVGEPDPIRGEVVHAFVVTVPGREATERELIEYARGFLVYYKCPHRVTFLKEMPRTLLGKPSRRALRDLLPRR
ncbi:MAG: AMP-binding protein [Actinobacteria bacterium]|nr:AMP-binding protein [Actinomycetota bacterium]